MFNRRSKSAGPGATRALKRQDERRHLTFIRPFIKKQTDSYSNNPMRDSEYLHSHALQAGAGYCLAEKACWLFNFCQFAPEGCICFWSQGVCDRAAFDAQRAEHVLICINTFTSISFLAAAAVNARGWEAGRGSTLLIKYFST